MYQIGENVALRTAFGPALLSLAQEDPRIMVVTADLGGSVNLGEFKQAFPDRYINCGVAEADMISICAGLASEGAIPFAVTFGSFLGRAVDHIRQGIGHNKLKVNIVGSHGGISNGMDGPSAHAIEDVGIMRSMPNFTIVAPSCANQVENAIRASVSQSAPVDLRSSPVYLRLYREPLPVFTSATEEFQIGRAIKRSEGSDVTLLAYGPHVGFCMDWLAKLQGVASIDFLEVHTVQPLDEDAIMASVAKTGRVVTVEDHFIRGGLASAVAELLVSRRPAPLRAVALRDYARSGPYFELRDSIGLGVDAVSAAIEDVLTLT